MMPSAAAAVGVSVSLLSSIWMGAAIGYVSHIVGDMLTPSGVRLFYPSGRSVRVPLFVTGSILEWLFVLLVAVAAVGVVFLI